MADVYAPLEERWAHHDLSLLRYGGSQRLRINGNWKLAMENFQEGYHLPMTHPFLNSLSSLENHYSVVEPAYQGQGSHYYDTVEAGHGDLPNFPDLPDYWKHRAEYPAVMPNLMFGMHPDHFLFFGVIPLSPSLTEEVFHFYFIGDAALGEKHNAMRERVMTNLSSINAEDIGVVESMQAGRHSPGWETGPFSPYQEATLHQFQLKIAKMLDAASVTSVRRLFVLLCGFEFLPKSISTRDMGRRFIMSEPISAYLLDTESGWILLDTGFRSGQCAGFGGDGPAFLQQGHLSADRLARTQAGAAAGRDRHRLRRHRACRSSPTCISTIPAI